MSVLTNFIIGLIAAIVGVIPPGLLNMSAAKISSREGRRKGLLFSFGVCLTVFIQTYIALIFARYLDRHPEIIDVLQKVALGIFVSITIYFFLIANNIRKEPLKEVNNSRSHRVFSGMILAALNLLPIPYWVYISITFSSFGWFQFTTFELWAAVLGSSLGSFIVLAIYVWFFRKKDSEKKGKFNMNYIIGMVTAIISIITFIKILNDL
jgi:threonine/homoserine/homoserine lactone efflux protein